MRPATRDEPQRAAGRLAAIAARAAAAPERLSFGLRGGMASAAKVAGAFILGGLTFGL
ncbi:hypothetical protein FRACA_3970007 [Frankia canadensis]|uniref:Uncharacterized protein n=1 Tax=Frankia canadensis TaxID=1836972 RepID=A0A2I2KWA6_9ACTN|nr:hypothetical protein FRACA_3970007 [Frankia canadensis]SOU57257.1 hypothetical protein FRACA_3970007 [Frankia canadensis]